MGGSQKTTTSLDALDDLTEILGVPVESSGASGESVACSISPSVFVISPGILGHLGNWNSGALSHCLRKLACRRPVDFAD
jgi:hypothetical protein